VHLLFNALKYCSKLGIIAGQQFGSHMIAPLLGYSVIGILYDIIIGPNLSAPILRTDAINYASIFVRASLYSCRSPVCREAAAIGRIGKQAAIF